MPWASLLACRNINEHKCTSKLPGSDSTDISNRIDAIKEYQKSKVIKLYVATVSYISKQIDSFLFPWQ